MTALAPIPSATRAILSPRALLAFAGLLVATAVGASAASLGGVAASSVGTGAVAGFGHPAGVAVRWTPALAGGQWVVSALEVTTRGGETFAADEDLNLALLRADGVSLCQISRTIPAAGTTRFAVSSAELLATCGSLPFSMVDRIAVAIGA